MKHGGTTMYLYIFMLIGVVRARVTAVRSKETRDLGASAIEWAIIAAVSVVIATLIGGIIYNVVSKKGDDLQKCADTVAGPNVKC
jgi:Flp pilus assembly pilin Flp